VTVGWRSNCGILVALFLILCLLSLWFLPRAEAGWTLVATITTPARTPFAMRPPPVITVAAHNKIKYETHAWTQIIDLTTQRLLLINHIQQLYWEGSLDEYVTIAAARALGIRTQRDKLLQQLPPERRMTLEKRGGPFDSMSATLAIALHQTTEREIIAGYEARKYVVLRNGEPYEEVWLAKAIDFGAEIDKQKFKKFMEKLRDSRTTPPGTVLAELIPLAGKGYPVKTVNLLSQVTKEIQQAEKKNIADEEFAVPQHYTQKTLAEVMATPQIPARSSP